MGNSKGIFWLVTPLCMIILLAFVGSYTSRHITSNVSHHRIIVASNVVYSPFIEVRRLLFTHCLFPVFFFWHHQIELLKEYHSANCVVVEVSFCFLQHTMTKNCFLNCCPLITYRMKLTAWLKVLKVLTAAQLMVNSPSCFCPEIPFPKNKIYTWHLKESSLIFGCQDS